MDLIRSQGSFKVICLRTYFFKRSSVTWAVSISDH